MLPEILSLLKRLGTDFAGCVLLFPPAAGVDKTAAAAACAGVPVELLNAAVVHSALQQQQQLATFLQLIDSAQ